MKYKRELGLVYKAKGEIVLLYEKESTSVLRLCTSVYPGHASDSINRVIHWQWADAAR